MKKSLWLATWTALALTASAAFAQSGYQTITVSNGGTIRGTVKWTGPAPKPVILTINKNPDICDPQSQKKRDLERILVGPNGGVANTVVFLKNISQGKAMDLPAGRQFLNQKTCRYEPHILLVPQNGQLQIKSSDPVLHTAHMSGAADYNTPFPIANQVVARTMQRLGLVDIRCNAGHVWMNGEILVVAHPYYAVTDKQGRYMLTDVPPGEYEVVAWHEGWNVVRQETLYDVMTELKVQRPVFSDPVTWSRKVTVAPNQSEEVDFSISSNTTEFANNR